MGIGNLDVSVTGTTRYLRDELKALRHDLGATGAAALKADRDFAGTSIGEWEKRVRKAPKMPLPPLRDAEKWRSQIVDLSRDTDRYTGALGKQIPFLKQLEKSFKFLKGLGKIAIAASVFTTFVDFGQRIKIFASDVKTLGDAWRQAKAFVGYGESIGEEETRRLEEQNERTKEKIRLMDEELERRRDIIKAHNDEIAAAQRREKVAQLGEENVAFAENARNPLIGAAKAEALRQATIRAANAESQAAFFKEQQEERVAKIKDLQREQERAHEKAVADQRKKRAQEEDKVRDFEKEARQFWMSDAARRRDDAMREITDPALRRQAGSALERLEVADRVKKEKELADKNQKDLAKQSLAATEADSREGFKQRASIRREAETVGYARKQTELQEEMLTQLIIANTSGSSRSPARLRG
jgi:hypothetical protein